MVAEIRAAFPSARYRHASRIEMQYNFCRRHWAIEMDGQTAMEGFDVTEVNDAGKVVKVIGFFGRLDPGE